MASTRQALREIAAKVDESMGVRQIEVLAQHSPVPSARDAGRMPLRTFGRVEVDRIIPDPKQPRAEFDEAEIQSLAASIQKSGQLHPIRVRWEPELQRWVIVSGERRWRATRAAGLSHIDCYFHKDGITQSEVLEEQLVENLLRRDLKPIEEARGFAALMELNAWTGRQVAEALRVSPSRISRALALLELPEDVQLQVNDGLVPRTSAYELSKLQSESAQRSLAQQAAAGDLTHKQATGAVRQRRGKQTDRPRALKLTFPAENGVRVTVTANRIRSYFEVEEALQQALDEVKHRIENNVQLF